MKMLRTLLVLAFLLPGLAQAAVVVKGGTSGTNADVDANKRLLVQPGQNAKADAPWSQIRGEIDNYGLSIPSSRRLIVGGDNTLMQDVFIGTTVNGLLWTVPVSGFTIAQSGGKIMINNGLAASNGNHGRVTSQALFGPLARMPLEVSARIIHRNLGITNVTAEFGLFTGTAATAPTDGAFFRWYPNGEFRAVLNFNGAETLSPVLTAPTGGNGHDFRLIIYGSDDAHFFVDGVEVADLSATVTEPSVILNKNPVNARIYIAPGNAGLAPTMEISNVNVRYLGGPGASMEHSYGLAQRSVAVSPATGLQLTRPDHSTTSMTLTSNTAPANNNMGGDFIFAAPAGASTEFPIYAYAVPAGFRLVVKSIRIDAVTYGAAVTTTPTVLQWGVAFGASTSTMATADDSAFAAMAPRRHPIGTQIFPVSTTVGAAANPINCDFPVPFTVESGRYFHVYLSVPIGTATASQIIRGSVYINGYFE